MKSLANELIISESVHRIYRMCDDRLLQSNAVKLQESTLNFIELLNQEITRILGTENLPRIFDPENEEIHPLALSNFKEIMSGYIAGLSFFITALTVLDEPTFESTLYKPADILSHWLKQLTLSRLDECIISKEELTRRRKNDAFDGVQEQENLSLQIARKKYLLLNAKTAVWIIKKLDNNDELNQELSGDNNIFALWHDSRQEDSKCLHPSSQSFSYRLSTELFFAKPKYTKDSSTLALYDNQAKKALPARNSVQNIKRQEESLKGDMLWYLVLYSEYFLFKQVANPKKHFDHSMYEKTLLCSVNRLEMLLVLFNEINDQMEDKIHIELSELDDQAKRTHTEVMQAVSLTSQMKNWSDCLLSKKEFEKTPVFPEFELGSYKKEATATELKIPECSERAIIIPSSHLPAAVLKIRFDSMFLECLSEIQASSNLLDFRLRPEGLEESKEETQLQKATVDTHKKTWQLLINNLQPWFNSMQQYMPTTFPRSLTLTSVSEEPLEETAHAAQKKF